MRESRNLKKDFDPKNLTEYVIRPKGKEKILEIERGSTRSHPVENSLWKRLRTCRKRDYRMNEHHSIDFTRTYYGIEELNEFLTLSSNT
jgi:hypothetical protein